MQKGFVQFIILGVVVLAVVAAGAFYLGRTTQKPTSPQNPVVSETPNPSPTSSASPTPTGIDETANWKTYTNTKEGYSIKYPLSWYARDGIVTDYDSQVTTEQLAKTNEHLTIKIIVWDNPSKLSTEAYVSQLDAGPDAPQVTNTDKVTIGGALGIKRIENRYSIVSPTRSTQPTMVIYLAHSERIIIISAFPVDSLLIKTFKQILYSFKFLDQNNYCDSKALGGPFVRIEDCGSFQVLVRPCCDQFDVIIDRKGNKITECGGFTGYSKECKEKFHQTNCSEVLCKINQ